MEDKIIKSLCDNALIRKGGQQSEYNISEHPCLSKLLQSYTFYLPNIKFMSQPPWGSMIF